MGISMIRYAGWYHPHLDHFGLARIIEEHVPLAMGKAAETIIAAAAPFVSNGKVLKVRWHLEDRKTLRIGPFVITPFLVDHSAFDAYAVLVEAGGNRLFYTGDLRDHGRKGSLVHRLIDDPPPAIDTLLMEGTMLGRDGTEEVPTESALEDRFVELFSATSGMVLVAASAQNIDRVVTVFRAAKRSKRVLVIDLYAAAILEATGRESIPQSHWPEVRLFVPQWQRSWIVKNNAFELLRRHSANRVFPEDLAGLAPRAAVLFRDSMKKDLEDAKCLTGAHLVWSQWGGYLREAETKPLRDWRDRLELPMTHIHTSGHATVDALQKLARAINPKRVVPIHTDRPSDYFRLFDNVECHEDGEKWEVAPEPSARNTSKSKGGYPMDNASWEQSLREAHIKMAGGEGRRIRVPGMNSDALTFSGDAANLRIYLSESAVTSNMQTDAAAFEAWILALKAWCGVEQATLGWKEPEGCFGEATKGAEGRSPPIKYLHYQRFLYRVDKFLEAYGQWFGVDKQCLLNKSKVRSAGKCFLNVRGDSEAKKANGSEAALEMRLVSEGNCLLGETFNLKDRQCFRQLPVGVFEKDVKAKNAIFPRGKSAIDLYGVDDNRGLWIFELKDEKNTKLGIVSEALCYAWIMRDLLARDGIFTFPDFAKQGSASRRGLSPDAICECGRIEVVLLAPAFHPLLDDGHILDLLNENTVRSGIPIHFQMAKLKLNGVEPCGIEILHP